MFVKKYRLSLCSALLLALCNGCSNDSTATKVTAGAEADTRLSSTPARFSETTPRKSTTLGKPGAQISLADNRVYQLEPGVETGIEITLRAPYPEGEMRVDVNASDGLAVVGDTSSYTFALGDGKTYTIPLKLLAADHGRYYVSMHIAVLQDGRETFKAISAIVQAGAEVDRVKASAPSGKATDSDGVVSLPAEEVIIQE